MKIIDLDEINKLPGKKLEANDIFRFRCHAALSCFNQCCHNLNLFLSPYDVIRLKNRLAIDSDQFIDHYVDVVLRESNYFPEVLLRMSEQGQRACSFLEKSGCRVYSDRPNTCQLFPVEQGLIYQAQTQKPHLIHFFKPPDFCRGPFETKEWTPEQWSEDQQAVTPNQMTLRWAELKRLFQNDPWGIQGPAGSKAKMAFMATFNLDRFRDFVFKSSFLKRYKVKTKQLHQIEKDDVALLNFGFEWVKLFVWGLPAKSIRPR